MAGTIRIKTKLDTSGVRSDLKDLNAMINRAARGISDATKEIDADPLAGLASSDAVMAQFEDQMTSIRELIGEISSSMDALSAQSLPTQQYSTAQAELDALNAKFDKLIDKQAKMQALGVDETSQSWQALQYDIEHTAEAISQVEARMQEMRDAGTDAVAGSSTAEYQQQAAALSAAVDRYHELESAAANYRAEVEAAGYPVREWPQLFNRNGNILKRVFKDLSKTAESFTGKLTKGLGKAGLALIGVRSAFMALRKIVSTYMAENEELSAQMSSIWSFVANAAGPAIEYVVGLLIKAVQWVNSFINALAGINLIANSNAKALKKQAGAAGAAAKAQSAAFDEQTKLADAAGGGGGSSAGQLDSSIFELPDFAQMMVDAIKSGDWKSVGSAIADGLNLAINKADTESWGKKLTKGVSGALKAINGAIEGFDWRLLTRKIGAFFSNIDWTGIISDIAEGVGAIAGAFMAIIDQIAEPIEEFFTDLGGNLERWFREGINGQNLFETAFTAMLDFFKNIGDWIKAHVVDPFVDGFKKAFEIHSPSKVMQRLGELIMQGLIVGITSLVDKVIATFRQIKAAIVNVCNDVKTWLTTTFDETWDNVKEAWNLAGDFFKGIWSGIKDTFKDVSSWLSGKFKDAWDGAKGAWSVAGSFFSTTWSSIKTVFNDAPSWFSSKFSSAWIGAKNAWSSASPYFSDIYSKIKSAFSGAPDWFKSTFTSAWGNVKSAFSGWESFFTDLWNKIKNKFSSLGGSIGDAIGGAVKSSINSVIALIESTINRAITIINSAISGINRLNIAGKSLSSLSKIQLPRLAQGGIVNNPGRGVPIIAGEAGSEAVLPLDRNTEWMDMLAERINGGPSRGSPAIINIYLGAKKIARYTIDMNEQRAFELNA